jgi:hypothetical protein
MSFAGRFFYPDVWMSKELERNKTITLPVLLFHANLKETQKGWNTARCPVLNFSGSECFVKRLYPHVKGARINAGAKNG